MDKREKIIEIIAPFISAYGEDEAIADALIAANIGDVTEWKERAEKHRFMALPDGRIKQLYSDEEVEDIARQRDEYKHRAEVAERALLLMARGECPFASPEFYKEEAEKEIAMEEQMMANRCGEGKCEYFESTRRAANNNRENGYCKKYKQELHLYDWWWLKCDECTAEKKITEEKGK